MAQDEERPGPAGMPWWRSRVVVTLLGALAAAVAPLTVGVQEHIRRQNELALAEKEQDFKMRMAFLNLAIDPVRTPADRQLVLRFLKAASKDEALVAWATAELTLVSSELDEIKQELKEKEATMDARARAEEQARAEVEALRRVRQADEAKLREAEARLAQAAAEKAVVQEETFRLKASLRPGAAVASQDPGLVGIWNRAMRAQPADECQPGSVQVLSDPGVPREVAQAACERELALGAAATRNLLSLTWSAPVAGQAGQVGCMCALQVRVPRPR